MGEELAERDRYEIIREIGAGGVGVVYEALDRQRDARVALKTLRHLDAAAIARFKAEFRALSDVVHRNLVQLYELVVQSEDVFFTMELIDGVSFSSWVRRPLCDADTAVSDGATQLDTADTKSMALTHAGTPAAKAAASPGSTRALPGRPRQSESVLDVARLRDAMAQLAAAVSAIHRLGLIHRDLKPSNVLIERGGRVVVLDFGLVAEIDPADAGSHDDGRRVGTPAYMSPEQGANQPLSEASDWYSVGVMLFAALTGRLPFVGGHADVLMDKQLFEPPSPRELSPGVPEDLDALCVELLRRDPERRPTGGEVLRRLGVQGAPEEPLVATPGRSTLTAGDALLGRDLQLAELGRALHDTRDGHPVLCEVRGLSGMGKSALVRRFLDEARAGGRALVLRGRCYERESVPFKALDSLVDSLGSHLAGLPRVEAEGVMPRDALALARLFPVLRQVEAMTAARLRRAETPDSHELRRRAFGAMRELMTRLSDRQPIVIALDDLQWGDEDSAALLAALLAPPDPPAILLLAMYREEEAATGEFLRAFRSRIGDAAVDRRTVEVGPLSADDALRLARAHLGPWPEAIHHAERIARESSGSPFFIEELARHVGDHAGEDGASVDEDVSLESVIRQRLRRLSGVATTLLETIAVAGRPVPQFVAFRAAGSSDPGAVAVLKAGSFIRARSLHGQRYLETYHDRVRETVVADLRPGRLRERHRRLANALEILPHPDAEALAVHLRGAGELARAAAFAVRAADRAAESLAFDRAARLYRMALELESADGQDRRRLWIGLGDALANAGRGVDAADAYLAAADGAAAAERLELRRRAGQALFYCGHVERALDIMRDVLGELGVRIPKSPGRALMSLLKNRARLALRGLGFRERDESEIPMHTLTRIEAMRTFSEGMGNVAVIHATDFAVRQLIASLNAGEPKRIVRALANEVVFVSSQGIRKARRSRQILDVMTALSERLDDPAVTAMAIGVPGMVAMSEGRWADTHEACAAAGDHIRSHCKGLVWELNVFGLFELYGLALSGRIADLMRRQTTLIREASERGDLHAVTNMVSAVGLYAGIVPDEPERGYGIIEDTLARWDAKGFHFPHMLALMGLMWLDVYCGDAPGALERMHSHRKAVERSLLLRVQTTRGYWRTVTGRAALEAAAVGGDAALLRSAQRAAKRLAGENVRWATAWAAILRSGIAAVKRDEQTALDELVRAEQLCAEDGMTLYVHNLRRRRGELIGGDEGAALVAAADAHMTAEGIRNPGRFTRSIVPGFDGERARLTR